ncbi:MAG: glycosyltransferase family 4 protein [Deltaproteobacteria bacterium]|nr:MAG: glycosyltransferase family 4 protein [Deltaproteobacteria bacterium]
MRILFLSALYSSAARPQAGVGNGRIVRAMRPHAALRLVVPVPWYPEIAARRSPRLRAERAVPREEIDDDGSAILHPRIAHIPRVGRSLYPALYAASLARTLRREVDRFRPDAILTAWAYPDGVAAVALGRHLGLPVVMRVMGSDINDYAQQALRRPQIAWGVRHAARIIAVSRALADECGTLGAASDRIDYVPTGVDRAVFHPVDRDDARRQLGLPPVGDARVVVVPGRLSPEKGVLVFLDAWRQCDPSWRAVLVGDGPQRADIERRIAELGLGDRVQLAGFQPESRMKLYYAAADAACLPSFEEGWPDVLVESFACGCPWVASDVGGVADVLALTGAGYLVPPRDPGALAARLRDALARTWDRAAIARAMDPYTLDETAQRYVESCARAARDRAR